MGQFCYYFFLYAVFELKFYIIFRKFYIISKVLYYIYLDYTIFDHTFERILSYVPNKIKLRTQVELTTHTVSNKDLSYLRYQFSQKYSAFTEIKFSTSRQYESIIECTVFRHCYQDSIKKIVRNNKQSVLCFMLRRKIYNT